MVLNEPVELDGFPVSMVQAPASAPVLCMSIRPGALTELTSAILRKAKWTVTVFPSGVLSQQFTGKTIKPKVLATIDRRRHCFS